jgi:hypothetical protein
MFAFLFLQFSDVFLLNNFSATLAVKIPRDFSAPI